MYVFKIVEGISDAFGSLPSFNQTWEKAKNTTTDEVEGKFVHNIVYGVQKVKKKT